MEQKENSFRPVVEVEETDVEASLKKRIAIMEEEEKQAIEAHSKKVEAEKAEVEKVAAEEKKLNGTFSNFGGLPKYQELFKAPKLPPLPPAPIFPSQNEDVKIPQPAQLIKKQVTSNLKQDEEKKPDDKKMDYDKLFGN